MRSTSARSLVWIMSDPSWDAYFIPGTHAMRNKFTRGGRFPDGIPSMVAVGALEEHWARLRLIELVRSPLLGHFDYEHMRRFIVTSFRTLCMGRPGAQCTNGRTND